MRRECHIPGYVDVQIVIEVDELISGEIALGGKVDHRQQLPLESFLGFLALLELLEFFRVEGFY